MPRLVFRQATREDFEDIYGVPPQHTFRAIVGEADGVLVGIGGVILSDVVMAFQTLLPGWEKYKRDMVRGTRLMMERIKEEHCCVYAIPEPTETAPGFLRHFGFEPLGGEYGVYQWVPKR